MSSAPRISEGGGFGAAEQGWTTRQLRVVLLLAVALLLFSFFLLRGREESPEPAPSVSAADAPAAGGEAAPVAGDPEVDAPVRERPAGGYVLGEALLESLDAALAAGDEALAAGRLYAPPGDNALRYYLGALALDPDSVDAAEGLAAVQARLRSAFREAIGERRLDEAAELLEVLGAAEPDEAFLTQARSRLEVLQRAEDFLVAARADREAGRVLAPSGANALARLARARSLDPEHPLLEAEFEALEGAVVSAVLAEARAGRFSAALAMLARAAEVLPGSARLEEARRSVEAYREGLLDENRQALAADLERVDFEAAQARIERARTLEAGPERIAEMEAALEHARLYGRFEPGEVFTDRIRGELFAPPMVVLPAGEFWMGSPLSEPGHQASEAPRHRVRFRRGFALGLREVTVGEFGHFVRATGYRTDAEEEGGSLVYQSSKGRIIRRRGVSWRDGYTGRRADPGDPVLHVSWNDADAYAQWLARATGESYRLPSESEFEYGIRGDTDTPYWWGAGSPERPVENLTGAEDRSEYAGRQWSRAFEGYGDGFWGPAPAGSLLPNPFSLLDMAGNVEEWVADCWHDSYVRAPSDGRAWVNPGCPRRVLRGGFWGGAPETARSAYRAHYPPNQRGSSIGFRVARDLY